VRLGSALLILGAALPAAAQRDSTSAARLDPVVVTAERARTTLSRTPAAISRLAGEALRRHPEPNVAAALRFVPGFVVIDFDGLGQDPQLMTRGFYGGGEAEYVVVLVDGRPVNQVHTGRVAWDALPRPEAIVAIEVLHGAASPVWGDAAIGGVINIMTRPAGAQKPQWSVSGGSYGAAQASVDASRGGSMRGSLSAERSSGFRDHSARSATGARAGLTLVDAPRGHVSVGLVTHLRQFEEPGALLDDLLPQDRMGSDALFRFDETRDLTTTVRADGEWRVARSMRLRTGLSGEWRDIDATRTLALAPGFGDTRDREAGTVEGRFTVQLERDELPREGQLAAGAEVARGSLDSRYYEVISGTRDGYAAATGSRGALSVRGDASRIAGSVFASYGMQLWEPVRLTLGARGDWLRDDFEPEFAAGQDAAAGSHAAFSPRIGITARYLDTRNASGHFFVSASQSFKAPTLDQLFDQRPIPVPFPPFTLTTSNAELSPQYGLSYEAGMRHAMERDGGERVDLTLTIYQMDMRNELDFDVSRLRYVNIGRSRHRGVEGGATWQPTDRLSLFANYTLQAATTRAGDNAGKALKAIPRQALAGGVTLSPAALPEVRLTSTHARDVYLDDANTVRLPAWTRVDLHLTQRVGSLALMLQLRNLLGARHSTTGFLDPSGSGQVYYHPAAGRTLQLGLRSGG
jgi:outer membrane receptor protein involved in Fe transport